LNLEPDKKPSLPESFSWTTTLIDRHFKKISYRSNNKTKNKPLYTDYEASYLP